MLNRHIALRHVPHTLCCCLVLATTVVRSTPASGEVRLMVGCNQPRERRESVGVCGLVSPAHISRSGSVKARVQGSWFRFRVIHCCTMWRVSCQGCSYKVSGTSPQDESKQSSDVLPTSFCQCLKAACETRQYQVVFRTPPGDSD